MPEPYRVSGALLPTDRAAATAIQDEMAKRTGEDVVGWKVGGELVGRVFEWDLYSSPASLPAERFRDALVEVELGFRLLANLPARSEPYGVDELVEAASKNKSAKTTIYKGRTTNRTTISNVLNGAAWCVLRPS